jgi:pseudouridine-5'-monophosphatase
MRRILAVLFDFDGVISDTEPRFNRIYQLFSVQRTGKRMDPERLKALKTLLFGRSLTETIGEICREIGIEPVSIEEFRAFQDPHLAGILPDAPLMPGAERLIRHLASHRVPMAVATSSPRSYLDLKVSKRRELFGLFGAMVTADDVAACKPAPDLFLKAAERLCVNPKHCLVLEDAPSGIRAAKQAGMTAIAIPPPGVDPCLYANADRVLSSIKTLDLAEWGLPDLRPARTLEASSS